jgi:hypothetical protein
VAWFQCCPIRTDVGMKFSSVCNGWDVVADVGDVSNDVIPKRHVLGERRSNSEPCSSYTIRRFFASLRVLRSARNISLMRNAEFILRRF